ncbi:nucleic acid-binding, OB-fold protein [Artemisia annua]|uniref:Nucleic acid-binding, OB-fold protein n=1 Tax=Artemisia annua TaxID=35608 RepID=A0A2U1NTP4_ARTAN|nr:nucleic acid-binding, OB-fold protein [Artemisia annua]
MGQQRSLGAGINIRGRMLRWNRANTDRIPTMSALRRRNIVVGEGGCYLCGEEDESTDHIFTACRIANGVWAGVASWCRLSLLLFFLIWDVQVYIDHMRSSKTKKGIVYGVLILTVWCIWKARNDKAFANIETTVAHIVADIKGLGVLNAFWVVCDVGCDVCHDVYNSLLVGLSAFGNVGYEYQVFDDNILRGVQGDAIQANMEVSEKKQFTTYLIPGKTYRISGFTCAPTTNCQQTLENRTSLSFTRFTKFDTIPSTGFPNHYFRFISYNRLPYRVVDPDDKSRKVYPVLTDYIGCYINSGQKEEWGNPNKDQMLLRRIEIQNLNRNSVELTLWDDLAESFPKEKIDALEKPVIIAVSSCRVARFRNNLQLSSTPATYYYINPAIPELPQYKAEYKAAFDLNPPLQVVRHPYQDKEQEKMRNKIPFSKLLTENPLTHTDVRFTCEGTITGLDTSREWYYPSCATCPNKIQVNEGIIECKIHGALSSPIYRYNFKAYVTDTTATITMTFFSTKADDIVGISCQTLVDSLENPDPREFPERILAVIGRRHIFQFHYNTNSRQGPVTFILHRILDKPETTSHITDKPLGSGTIEESSENIEIDVPEQQQTATAIEYTPPTTSPPRPKQLPSPVSQVSLAQTESATNIIPTSQSTEAPESPEGNPLQQEDIQGEEVPPASPTYTYMQTRSRHGKQVAVQLAGSTPPTEQEAFNKAPTKTSAQETTKVTTAN